MQSWLDPHFNTWLQHTFYEIFKIDLLAESERIELSTFLFAVQMLFQLSYDPICKATYFNE